MKLLVILNPQQTLSHVQDKEQFKLTQILPLMLPIWVNLRGLSVLSLIYIGIWWFLVR